jgi:uncharacterized protein (DUF1697 family)
MMATLVALLRAVNVGGTGKLPMADLRALCEAAGFENVTTYIQSGNVVFSTTLPTATAKKRLEDALQRRLGKPVGVLLRTPLQLAKLVNENPFPKAAPNRVIVHFLDRAVPAAALRDVRPPGGERVEPAGRAVYVHDPDGPGRSRLRLPFADRATGRNLNTVKKLAELGRNPANRC